MRLTIEAKRRQLSLIKVCVCGQGRRGRRVSQSSSSEEQHTQQLKMVTITQDEGAEFQHAVFYCKGFNKC